MQKNNKEHKGTKITYLLWGKDDLFSANDTGAIYITPVGSGSFSFFKTTELLYKTDSQVIQMDMQLMPDAPTKYQLLVSSWTASTLLTVDLQTKQVNRLQVGTKKREGMFE